MTVVFNPLSRLSRKTFAASFSSDFSLGVVCLCACKHALACVFVCVIEILYGLGVRNSDGVCLLVVVAVKVMVRGLRKAVRCWWGELESGKGLENTAWRRITVIYEAEEEAVR